MPAPIMLNYSSGLGPALSESASILGSALLTRQGKEEEKEQLRQAEQKQQQYGSIMASVLQDLPQDASPMQITNAMMSAAAQGVPLETVQKQGALYSALAKSSKEGPPGPEKVQEMSNLFEKFGMEPQKASDMASLWFNLTVGGQTEMAKVLVDQISRSQFQPMTQSSLEQSASQAAPSEMIDVSEQVEVEETPSFQWPKVNVFEDRTPKERAQLKTELLKQNNAEIKEISVKEKGANQNLMRYEQLERLNNSGKLPAGLERLNINWTTGDIRYPALANPETQLYVKTVMDFMSGAKDTFGARVTNFEIGTFLKRLPTLANSEEGRRVLLEQMKAVEELNKLYYDSIQEAYKHYGTQKIDRGTVESVAEEYRADQEKELVKKFNNASQAQEAYEARQLAPEGRVPARAPDGRIVYIWRHQADKAQEKGYEPL